MMTTEPYDAIVLAGGRARRLAGADKPGLVVGGRALVAWVGAAAATADRLVVVGPERPEVPGAVTVREDPPGGGPVPALRTGLARVRADWVAVLAADLPFLRPEHIDQLRRRAYGHAGAVLIDDGGRPQWLAGVWHVARLSAAIAGYGGTSLRGLMEPLGPERVRLPPNGRPAWYDCDTPDDAARASRLFEENRA
jgi:molybdopterin-guanine dinucleotide biosynthesis protein A